MRTRACMLLAAAALAACDAPPSPTLRAVRDTIGDTVVVRTPAGSVWGTTATLEPEVRIGVVRGEDEYMFGRVRSLAVGPDGSIYVMDTQVPALAYDPATGRPGDTVAPPVWDFEESWLVAQHVPEGGRTNTTMDYVPFAAEEHWAFSPLGYTVGGVSTRYAIDQYRPDGAVLRIERECEPVPVDPGERANREALARWNMRQTQPDWTWNGPPIPDHKPPFRGIHVGRDGRIWVEVSVPGERIPDDRVVATREDGPNPRPPVLWYEPLAYDVFEPHGTYLGRVETDIELAPYWNQPLFDGLHVWAVVKDDMDVQYVA